MIDKTRDRRKFFINSLLFLGGGIVFFFIVSMMIVDFGGRGEAKINLIDLIFLIISFFLFAAGIVNLIRFLFSK